MLVKVSELLVVNAEDVDLKARTMRVMGKGAKQRELPLGQTVTQALRRYQRMLEDVRLDDPFFVSRYGRSTLASGESGSLSGERTSAGRLDLGTYRIEIHNWPGRRGTRSP